jgi:hypothetical protein
MTSEPLQVFQNRIDLLHDFLVHITPPKRPSEFVSLLLFVCCFMGREGLLGFIGFLGLLGLLELLEFIGFIEFIEFLYLRADQPNKPKQR